MGIPGVTSPPWYSRKLPTKIIGSYPAIVVLALATYTTATGTTTSRGFAWALGAALIFLIAASVLQVVHALHSDRSRSASSPLDLLASTLVLYEMLRVIGGVDDENGDSLRITVHRVIHRHDGEPHELEQVVPYVGGKGGDVGRRFSAKCGIIGLVARTGDPKTAKREKSDYADFIRELVSEWNYVESEARQLTIDREAWMGVPLLAEGSKVAGVVYLDAKNRDFFDETVQNAALVGCKGIASYISRRYD